MELIDNINKTLALDLKETINPGSKISIAASCFSIYAYQELKEQLENIDQLQVKDRSDFDKFLLALTYEDQILFAVFKTVLQQSKWQNAERKTV